jgi:radical SAM protein with 4Fe4S-binding SPASM domain
LGNLVIRNQVIRSLGNREIVWSRVIKAASVKRIFNCFKAVISFGLSTITKKSIVWGVPPILTVEPTVHCNLHCPQCLTGMGRIVREQSSLSLNSFKHIIEQIGDRTWYLLLFNQGEPFLNSNLIEFIEIAKQKRIYVTTSTNGHFLTDKNLVRKLVTSGLDSIIISLDGVDEDSYSKYRKGGDFHQVIEGIKILLEVKNELHANTPAVLIQCLVMKHNENQIEHIEKLAGELKADRLLFKTFQVEFGDDGVEFLPDNPGWRRYHFENDRIHLKNRFKSRCFRLWYSAVILSDGRIVPCCFDKNGEYNFGNINQSTAIEKIWKSDGYNKFRNRVLRGPGSIPICQNCTENQKVYL